MKLVGPLMSRFHRFMQSIGPLQELAGLLPGLSYFEQNIIDIGLFFVSIAQALAANSRLNLLV